ncbi:MAG: TauD/TfdA family dioxygenase [Pseudomonadota bacterium]
MTSASATSAPAAAEPFSVQPLKGAFGSLISGVDAATAGDETLDKVVDCFEKSGAIVLRNQTMEPEDLKHFLRKFGPLEGHTLQQFTLPGHPEIFLLSNIEVDGKPIGAHNDGVGWHTDYSYKEQPVKCTMLYALQVPDEGSDTLFADCCAAYDALPEDKRALYEGLKLHHSYKYFMETREHGRMTLSPEIEAANPDVIHPLIRTHPANGRKALWPSTGTVKEVIGIDDKEEGLKLLDQLVEFVTQDRFVHRHKWQVGDLVLWDNRCTLHTGTLFDDTKYKRLMHRMWAKGDTPY